MQTNSGQTPEASVALDKFISLITFTPAYAKNMIDDLCISIYGPSGRYTVVP
ncbi:hypothetical protein J3458_009592 [Metarhizium acridum]|uniref:uncharacterized protein n=1 Tax=Metarhizium acridum TaxID=92637 RepID=UPI001C6C1381|nr:hypothetical protein J3458_009592 [Metarhizium acridum]